jgi:hypothetical protein
MSDIGDVIGEAHSPFHISKREDEDAATAL